MTTTLLLFWALTACTKDDPIDTDTGSTVDWRSLDVAEPGPFNVGHVTLEVRYVPFDGEPERVIPVDLWYPTEDPSGPNAVYAYNEDPAAFENAAAAAPIHDGGYPVHVHSHGYQGWGATSAFLMRHFASHGWVAVAPNHVNNLLLDHVSPLPTSHYAHRPLDIRQALDAAGAFDGLAGPIALDEVVLSGHSFGAAYNTWAGAGATYDNVDNVCATGDGIEEEDCTPEELAAFKSGEMDEPRVKVAIPMAGSYRDSWFGDSGQDNVHADVLFLSGDKDNPDSSQGQWDRTESFGRAFSWVELAGGCHQTFALGQCDTLDVELGFQIVNAYSLAFARQKLLGDDTAAVTELLDGTEAPWAEATLQIR